MQNVRKSYATGVQALSDINLNIGPGEFVVFLGPSGAGKSSLLRCINGLVKADDGTVDVESVSLKGGKREIKRLRSRIGMIFQQFHLVKRLSVLDNVLCGSLSRNGWLASSIRLFRREDIDLAVHCLERVGMKDKMNDRADRLSGGQQQRVAIARALAQKPSILLADEPVASLDPITSLQVMDILKQINEQDGLTVLVSLHDVELASRYGQRIVGINGGRIVVDRKKGKLTEEDLVRIYGERLRDQFEAGGADPAARDGDVRMERQEPAAASPTPAPNPAADPAAPELEAAVK